MTLAKIGTRSLALVALAGILAACQSNLDMEKVGAAIKMGLEEQLQIPIASVSCPEARAVEGGDVFDCVAAAETGGDLAVTVTQVDGAGNIVWELTNGDQVLSLTDLEEIIRSELAEQADLDATVDCGGKMRVSVPGHTFECTATAGAESRPVVVTIDDDRGNVSWAME
jgi:hypothetical protein